jgi:hypothetical protein
MNLWVLVYRVLNVTFSRLHGIEAHKFPSPLGTQYGVVRGELTAVSSFSRVSTAFALPILGECS